MIIKAKANSAQPPVGLSRGDVSGFGERYQRLASSSRLGFGRANFLLNAIHPDAPHAQGAEK
jgi:hypothetical protein